MTSYKATENRCQDVKPLTTLKNNAQETETDPTISADKI